MESNYLHQSSDAIDYYKIEMYRTTMTNIPWFSLPNDYSLRFYRPDSNDSREWASIAKAAGEFHTIEEGENQFRKSYLTHPDNYLLSERVYFLTNAEGKAIGTATAWFTEIGGEKRGSLEWVSIVPEYQGKKLAKPMVSVVLRKIAENFNSCHLYSQTTSWRAINMYAQFGFLPLMTVENSDKAWKQLSDICHRDFLALT